MTGPATLPAPPPVPGLSDAPHRLLGARASTRHARHSAVVSAIDLMHERLGEPLELRDLARAALLSPYHFNRVFRSVTGVPPGRFLTALRMAAARRILLTTAARVTDVCFEVGFESLGTFTTRFGQLVGVSPLQLRALTATHGQRELAGLVTSGRGAPHPIVGRLVVTDRNRCVAIVGAFRNAVPQGFPVSCCVSRAPGDFSLTAPSGGYHLLALGFPGARTVMDAMLLDPQDLLVATPRPLITPSEGYRVANDRLSLERPRVVDPPVVLAAPVLSAVRAPLAQVA